MRWCIKPSSSAVVTAGGKSVVANTALGTTLVTLSLIKTSVRLFLVKRDCSVCGSGGSNFHIKLFQQENPNEIR